MLHFINETSTNFYDIPSFSFLLEKRGYNKIILPAITRVALYFDNDTDEIVEVSSSVQIPKNGKLVKYKDIKPEGYDSLYNQQQTIHEYVMSEHFEMQKLVFTNIIKKEISSLTDDYIEKLFNKAYYIAYDKGHSAGYDEVTSYLSSETYNCIEYIKCVVA